MFAKSAYQGREIALVAALGLAAALAGCASTSNHNATPQDAKTANITVTQVRVLTPVVKDETGAFATVANAGTSDIRLVSVSVPKADAMSASVHTMAKVNGKMAMTPVKGGLLIKAGSTVMLKPGGYHIMLMAPHLATGQVVPVTFTFSNGAKLTVNATVQPAASASSSMKM